MKNHVYEHPGVSDFTGLVSDWAHPGMVTRCLKSASEMTREELKIELMRRVDLFLMCLLSHPRCTCGYCLSMWRRAENREKIRAEVLSCIRTARSIHGLKNIKIQDWEAKVDAWIDENIEIIGEYILQRAFEVTP